MIIRMNEKPNVIVLHCTAQTKFFSLVSLPFGNNSDKVMRYALFVSF